MKKSVKCVCFILILQTFMFLFCSESSAYNIETTLNKEHTIKKSIYSWDFKDIINISNFNESLDLLKSFRINELYQRISDFSEVSLKSRIKDLSNKNIKTYYLTGDPTWYAKPSSIIKRIDRVDSYNKSVEDDKERLSGIVLDIEPWTIGEFDIDTYSQTLAVAYAHAKSVNVKMILTIPFWLEDHELEKIVPHCDRISVMNYTRRSTISNISNEISIGKKYNIEVENISETKAPDGSGIPDSITFFNYGLDALNQEWLKLMEFDESVIYSYHDLKTMRLMLNKYPNSILLSKNKVFYAIDSKTEEDINSARESVNKLPESEEKKYLLSILDLLVSTKSTPNTSNFDPL